MEKFGGDGPPYGGYPFGCQKEPVPKGEAKPIMLMAGCALLSRPTGSSLIDNLAEHNRGEN